MGRGRLAPSRLWERHPGAGPGRESAGAGGGGGGGPAGKQPGVGTRARVGGGGGRTGFFFFLPHRVLGASRLAPAGTKPEQVPPGVCGDEAAFGRPRPAPPAAPELLRRRPAPRAAATRGRPDGGSRPASGHHRPANSGRVREELGGTLLEPEGVENGAPRTALPRFFGGRAPQILHTCLLKWLRLWGESWPLPS